MKSHFLSFWSRQRILHFWIYHIPPYNTIISYFYKEM
jgi:hypothetical protein